jgi:hypothetical protein
VKSAINKTLSGLRPLVLGIFALLAVAAPVPVFSQSCALCYTQAASSGSKMIQALRSGILILIVPPTIGTVGLIFVVYRRTNQVRRDIHSNEQGEDW